MQLKYREEHARGVTFTHQGKVLVETVYASSGVAIVLSRMVFMRCPPRDILPLRIRRGVMACGVCEEHS